MTIPMIPWIAQRATGIGICTDPGRSDLFDLSREIPRSHPSEADADTNLPSQVMSAGGGDPLRGVEHLPRGFARCRRAKKEHEHNVEDARKPGWEPVIDRYLRLGVGDDDAESLHAEGEARQSPDHLGREEPHRLRLVRLARRRSVVLVPLIELRSGAERIASPTCDPTGGL